MNETEASPVTTPEQALAQSNLLLTTITYNLPQIVLIISEATRKVVYKNYTASMALEENSGFLQSFLRTLGRWPGKLPAGSAIEFALDRQFYSVTAYPLLWKDEMSSAYLFNDISAQKLPDRAEKTPAHKDPLTKLHNRLAGIMILNKWLDMKKSFALCLANLDNLRYVNETYGKEEGNHYILAAAKHLTAFSSDTVVSRTGGDEFMILAPGFTGAEAETALEDVCRCFQEEISEKPYYCNMSYGITPVDSLNTHSASALLGLTDERMCQAKLLNKKRRLLIL